MSYEIEALGERIIAKELDQADYKGKIIIPETVLKERPTVGRVVAVGQLCVLVKAGDLIVYGKYTGTIVTIDDQEYLAMKEADILCRLIEKSTPQTF